MAEDFRSAVEDGLRLSTRIYFGNERVPPKPPAAMERSSAAGSTSHLPTCPMLYAVISNPEIVDNPDMPSYQPYIYGKMDPPALMPLQMNRISMEVDCYMDTAFVTVVGSWRVHCVMGSRSCDCRIAVPMGEQGSILGIEVEVPMRSLCTKLSATDNPNDPVSKKGHHGKEREKIEDEPYLTPHIFTVTIPKVDGGTNLTVKIRWSQKLIYRNDQFTLQVPFTFPDYVTPAIKKIAKHESIQMNVSPGNGTEMLCSTSSHPMKEQFRKSGKWGFVYDADVLSWSTSDFVFTYTLSTSSSLGTVLLSPSSSKNVDGRGMFYCYLFPGARQNEKAFKREMVFAVDISASMKGKLLENTKKAILAALAKLDPQDTFNIIAFNDEANLFSTSLRYANASCIEEATQWINANFEANGGTNIQLSLNQGMEIFSDSYNSIPLLFLITDGSVEDEKQICKNMESHLTNFKSVVPRIHTLGLGSFCNQYFLRKLALLGGGHHEAVYDVDSIEDRVGRLIDRASSIFLADIAFENLDGLSDLEVFPSRIPDLSSGSPMIVSGRFRGTFPEILKIKGNISGDLKVKEVNEDSMPIRKLVAKQEIEQLAAEAWYKDSQDLWKKIADISVQNGLVSEFTEMLLLETIKKRPKPEKTSTPNKQKVPPNKVVDSHGAEESKPQKILVVRNIGIGFGDLLATADNISPGGVYLTGAETLKRRRSKCLGRLCNYCCCMCCINMCSKINDQLATALAQLCCGFTCWGCFECCTSDACEACCCCCE